MPTIIDSLIVTLGLDPKAFTKGRGEVSAGLKGTREEAARTAKDMEAAGKRAGDFFGKMRNEAVGLFAAFTGASTLRQFATDMISGDAATGRLSRSIGLSTTALSSWQLALKTVNGTAGDADASLTTMADAYQSFMQSGLTGKDAQFRALLGAGFDPNVLKDPQEALLRIADALQKVSPERGFSLAKQLGLPESTIFLLQKGRAAVEAILKEKAKDAAASYADAKAAQELQDRLADLEAKITGKLRPSVYALVGVLIDLLSNSHALNYILPIVGLAVVAFTAPFIAAYAPILALGGVIGFLIDRMGGLESISNDLARDWRIIVASVDAFHRKDWTALRALARQAWTDATGLTGNGMKVDGDAGGYLPAIPPGGGYSDSFRASMGAPTAGELAGGGGGGGGSTRGGGGTVARDNSDYIQKYLQAAGFSPEQARGITAALVSEGGGLGRAANGAFGISQWRGERQAALKARYGNAPNLDQQLAFMVSELRSGQQQYGRVGQTDTAQHALYSMVYSFLKPGKDAPANMDRGTRWLAGGGAARRATAAAAAGGGSRPSTSSTSVGTINVYTAATDADGIAKALPGAIQRRGLTSQANRGLD